MASNSILLVQNTPATIIERVEAAMMEVRGVKQVVVRAQAEYDREARNMVETGWVSLYVRGTDLGVAKASRIAGILASEDQNADHDHQKCLDSARSMGVPDWAAHTPESYLSQ